MRLVVVNLAFSYSGGEPLISDLDFAAEAGELVALMGPSGSGKSTVLDLIGGLRVPSAGRIGLDEGGPDLVPTNEKHCSWVMQSNPVLRGRTALDNAALGLVAIGSRRQAARDAARSALAVLGMENRVNFPVGQLSGGEVQRVAIARSLISSRPLILADEPTGQLDASNTGIVITALKRAAGLGKVVVVATHDPTVASAADQVLDLRGSRSVVKSLS